jgi:hypothetical protein
MSKTGNRNGLADPSRLKPVDKDDKEGVRVIIETPKGSRNKYEFDQDEKAFILKKALPAGMHSRTTSASCLQLWRRMAIP